MPIPSTPLPHSSEAITSLPSFSVLKARLTLFDFIEDAGDELLPALRVAEAHFTGQVAQLVKTEHIQIWHTIPRSMTTVAIIAIEVVIISRFVFVIVDVRAAIRKRSLVHVRVAILSSSLHRVAVPITAVCARPQEHG